MPDPVPTRHEASMPYGVKPTRHEQIPAQTRREQPATLHASAILTADALPAALAGRLTDLTPLPTVGGEAHLLRARDAAHGGEERALKIYFPGIEPDPEVWSHLTSLRSRHVIAVLETGRLADGRFFELMEYLPAGSLRAAGAGRRPFDAAEATECVRQLADGLRALHAVGITHRDLKPENVLIRTGSPAEMVLSDFGLARRLASSARFTTAARTSAYAAPEAWAGHVSPARDWWSLGIMVRELATGEVPFDGLDERVVQMTVTSRPLSVDGIADVRLRRLAAGLLVADPAKRWSLGEVTEWLAGGSPPVPDRRVAQEVTPFELGGEHYFDVRALAAAMAAHWPTAARRFGITAGPSWAALTTWLHQFDDPGRSEPGEVEARLELLGELEASADVPNVKLVRLLAGLNRSLPPIYRDVHVDAAALRELARQAQDGAAQGDAAGQAREIIGELWDGRLLDALADFEGAAELRPIGEGWAAGMRRFDTAMAELARWRPLAGLAEQPGPRAFALAATLEQAAGAPRDGDWPRELDRRARALPVRIPWFDEVLHWTAGDPVRCHAAVHAAVVAAAEAQQVVTAQQAAERARLAREHAWAQHEQQRLAGQSAAAGTAVGGAAVLGGMWVLVLVLAVRTPAALVAVFLAIVLHLATEVVFAHALGTDYHPRYSLLQAVQEMGGRVGQRMRWSPRRWVVGIILTLLFVGFVQVLVPVAAFAAVAGHAAWALVRHRRWTADHEQDRQRALSG